MQGPDAQRTNDKVLHPVGTQRMFEFRLLGLLIRPPSEEDEDGGTLKPTQGKGERARRRGVEPLNIVDRDHDGLRLADDLNRVAHCNRERPPVDGIACRFLQEERDLERAPPRRRQHGEHLVHDSIEQIPEPYVSETPLPFRGSG